MVRPSTKISTKVLKKQKIGVPLQNEKTIRENNCN